MCGIIGVVGTEQASGELLVGMMHLQHRGQDASGMIVSEGKPSGAIRMIKDTGLVSSTFNESNIQELKGIMGVGFTRYPTVGIGDRNECQPFFLQNPDGIGLAFNGNVVNYPTLKKELEENERIYFSSHSDAEVLLHTFATEYKKGKGIDAVFDAVEKVQEKVIGGYSAAMLIGNKGVLCFKDPNGIRPLLIGERDNGTKSHAFASESLALSIQGYKNIRDLKPGEAVFIDNKGKVTSKILKKAKRASCVFEWVYFSTVESTLEGQAVYTVREKLGIELAKKVKERWPDLDIDYIMPVPDTSRPAAYTLSNTLKLPYGEGLVKNRYVQRTFIMPTQKIREAALASKMKPIEAMIRGKKVMVVDDSIVRGTTSKKIVKLLRAAGAKKVYLLSTFPPIRHPCCYGIDFQDENELVAKGRTFKEIEQEIGADKLIYMDVEGLQEALGRKDLCMACVTGEYPTPKEHMKELAELRKKHQLGANP